jgi:hypothetical protein
MSPRTKFLGKLIGLYCILVSLYMLTHKQAMLDMVTALLHNPSAMFFVGLLGTSVGLALILGHNVWSGGALPVVVTLVGWAALIKGLLFLFLSPNAAPTIFLAELHYAQLFYVYSGFTLLLGLYLTVAASRLHRTN